MFLLYQFGNTTGILAALIYILVLHKNQEGFEISISARREGMKEKDEEDEEEEMEEEEDEEEEEMTKKKKKKWKKKKMKKRLKDLKKVIKVKNQKKRKKRKRKNFQVKVKKKDLKILQIVVI